MIVVVGDVMCDVYVDGLVDRMSPDAPVPVLLRTGTGRRASGACLAAAAAARHGPTGVSIIGVVGDDDPGEFLKGSLHSAGVAPLLGVVPGCSSITKTRFRTGDHHLLRVDDDSTFGQRSREVQAHLINAWQQVRPSASAVLFSDYNKGALSEASIRHIIADSRADGLPVIVDSKRGNVSSFRGAQVWTPNEAELKAAAQADDEAAWKHICDWLELEALIVTRAEGGATVALRDGHHRQIAVPSLAEPRSVAGGGDVLAGVVAALVAQGVSWGDAAAEGVRVATEFVVLPPVLVQATSRHPSEA